ncbi:50S ribosomal protein L13 [Candidatus Kaiserbacteria bacterium]|nr:50S ribosomal protein L13 [Candidatus Kaiserbacteria bacterium]
MSQIEHTIDASGERLGRVASRAAKILMGKSSAGYTPHIPADLTLTISNASKMHIAQKKRLQKTYTEYSGHPGGLKRESLSHLAARKGHKEVLRQAIERMLPRNAMRAKRLKSLKISD